ncbi:MAG: CvpA family protein [Tannerella sp.]|jgi:membrane protein required for colicin V production|nr:CvpA family protein [Tannerella sp.]
MNWLDILILCLAAAGLIKGLIDGMIRQVVSLAAIVIGIYLCSGVAGSLSVFLSQIDWFPKFYIGFISYLIGFLLIVSIVLLAGKIVHRLVSDTPLSIFNHLTGGALGLVFMLLFISLMLNIIELLDKNSLLLSQELKVESRFYYAIKNIIPSILPGNLFKQLIV